MAFKFFQRKLLIRAILLFILLSIIALFFCNRAVENAAKGKLFTNVKAIPYNKVGLLLGTSKYLADGKINLYYQYRIEATIALFKNDKIKYIIISGDNSRKEYNEPADMKADLIAAGIDSTRIYLDYAGLRTFDSIVRLKEIFGQDSATIISQPFHNERALYIAAKEDIAAIGFNANDVTAAAGFKTKIREKLARVKVFADYLFNTKPKFLGNKINLP